MRPLSGMSGGRPASLVREETSPELYYQERPEQLLGAFFAESRLVAVAA
ncbi:hypothetical protein [Paenibacillus spiritus]|nr:hypothetical protein [Paenibacillus spiritus]